MSIDAQPDTRSRAYAIAAVAGVDYRPVAAWLRGGPLPRGSIGERIEAAAKKLGIVPAPDAATSASK